MYICVVAILRLFLYVIERMKLLMSLFGVGIRGMYITCSCLKRFVPEEYLDSSRIGALLGQIRSEAVAERVRGGRNDNAEKLLIPLDFHLRCRGNDTSRHFFRCRE